MKRSPCDGVAEYASKEGIWGDVTLLNCFSILSGQGALRLSLIP